MANTVAMPRTIAYGMLCLLAISLATPFRTTEAQIASPPAPRCTAAVLGDLSACLPALTGAGVAPTDQCCNAAKTANTASCFCDLETLAQGAVLGINENTVLELAQSCGVALAEVKIAGSVACPLAAAPAPAPAPANATIAPAPAPVLVKATTNLTAGNSTLADTPSPSSGGDGGSAILAGGFGQVVIGTATALLVMGFF